MPRLRNSTTGAVVNVSDEKAARMPAVWAPVEGGAKPAKKAAATKKAAAAPAADKPTE